MIKKRLHKTHPRKNDKNTIELRVGIVGLQRISFVRKFVWQK
jgi:hypothetical protein